MTEKRHNYLWGLSPANIITVFVILTGIVGAEAVDHFRIATLEKETEIMKKEHRKDKDVMIKISTDVAVIKSAVKRMERRSYRRRRETN